MLIFSVLERLAPLIEREAKLILNSKEEAESLKSKLEKIQEGLQDAERRGVTESNVKRWLKDLEEVMYEMDDALDKWETKNLALQIEQSEYDDISDPWEKVRSLFLSLCLSCKHVVGRRELTLVMKALSERLDKILAAKGKYNFVPNENDNSRELKKPVITSAVDESKIHGRESDKNSLVEFLVCEGEREGIQVMSIVGVGGLGKTTLAQLVFNDPRIEKHFGNLRAWVSVPNPFDSSKLAKAILETFGKSSSEGTTLQILGQRIKDHVSKKNFLLVLDDVWTVDRTEWESLKYFLVDEPGCRILVTTRDEIAARTIGTTIWPHLNLLSDLDCAKILNTTALEGRSKEEQERFRDIGFKIAKKCDGLPLAAKTIGNMLWSRFTIQKWKDVLDSPLWKYDDEMSDILRPFRLSYMDLSSILKRCVLSCVLYSKGSQFNVDELIRIWMAQGYISMNATWDEVQSKGMQYFEKLFMRSFFQTFRRYEDDEGDMKYEMHDMMHDFASYLARSEYYFILDNRTHNIPIESMEKARNFCARSVSLEDLPPEFVRLLKCVRVLCLSHCGLRELPQGVGELIHLRYLDLSWNYMEELPDIVCDLYNLQTFDLRWCHRLSRLPHRIRKLMNLRHLLIYGTHNLREYPEGLEKLTSLWTLDQFRATRDSVGYLRNLNQLRGSLEIIVEGLNEAAVAEKANLRDKNHIEELRLVFSEEVSMDVIEAMVPPPQLQSLTITGEGYEQQRLPSWIATTLFNNLKALTVCGFNDCSELLPALGKIPMLEMLKLELMRFKKVTLEFLGIIRKGTTITTTDVAVGAGFSNLKRLEFYNCFWWEEWEDLQEEAAAAAEDSSSVPTKIMPLPCLQELIINWCPNLKALPHRLLLHVATCLKKLTIKYSNRLESRYHEDFGADRDKISHIPTVDIYIFRSGPALAPPLSLPELRRRRMAPPPPPPLPPKKKTHTSTQMHAQTHI